ncbi:MAG: histidinol-phosphate transaminase [Elusimicrobia bacterium]|nr:histidinol-phosphate transaminase [Elusimicrobiota bacterium]MBK7207461.1 histidinol-phosphate transaminase [Elusimicrobiota bacterium]MBK7544231.1 histidinol-phosphate transaminase [Elusimicrobiota bacterium]MBK7573753.1 histidinol-phosphate transaminase [Elusimicrobiota bacterium]MBK7689351.1 histidinol-phosphate transaminase [Elusimicrobiota bacterium]
MGENDLIAPRREIAQFTPYVPGRDMDTVKKMYGLKRVVKLASNENALGPSPKAVAALRAAARRVNLYPDGFSTELRRALAGHLKVKPAQVTVGAGSDELIEILAKAYLTSEDDIVVSDHAFIRYKMAGDLMGSRVITVPMRGLTHDLEAMAAAVTPRTKFVFIANPNNPTGTHNSKTELEEFLITLPARVVAVVDEAYYEFARAAGDYPSALDFFKAGRNLVVLRTFSKAYGLAGVRLGYGVGPESLIETLERVRPPFNISIPAQAAGVAALSDTAHLKRSVALVAREKAKVQKALEKMGFPCVPSTTNFLLVRVSPRRGAAVFEALLRKGVIVRAMDEYGFPEHIRVTIGRPEENRLFLSALNQVK